MNELAWSSAVEQFALLERGEVSPAELRDAGIEACKALDRTLGFLVSPLFDRAPAGVPMLLKDAGQEIAGTHHYVELLLDLATRLQEADDWTARRPPPRPGSDSLTRRTECAVATPCRAQSRTRSGTRAVSRLATRARRRRRSPR